MKPLFKREKKMLQTELGINIPDFCWRETNNEVFLDPLGHKLLFKFEVNDTLDRLYLIPVQRQSGLDNMKKESLHLKIQKQIIEYSRHLR